METIILTDQSIEPNEEIVFSIIGEKRSLWEKLMHHIFVERNDMTGSWRYYNDGKSWLFRGLKKEKVVFWLAVVEDNFRVSFYLSGKAEPLIENSSLPQELKDGFVSTKGQKFRAISILVTREEDVENIKKLIEIKLKVK